MESSGSSFIPQRPTRGKVAPKSFRKVYILSYVSYLIFFTVLLAVGGIFFYKLTLQTKLGELQKELVARQQSFNQADLDRLKNLDQRIDTASSLVNNHASVVSILDALQKTVTDPVQLVSLNYDRTQNDGMPRLEVVALADEFDEVIFQEQILRNNAITDGFDAAEVVLTTQPIDPERLELGVQEVVSVTFEAELSVSEVNFTGFNDVSGQGGVGSDIVTDTLLPDETAETDTGIFEPDFSDIDFGSSDEPVDVTSELDALEAEFFAEQQAQQQNSDF